MFEVVSALKSTAYVQIKNKLKFTNVMFCHDCLALKEL